MSDFLTEVTAKIRKRLDVEKTRAPLASIKKRLGTPRLDRSLEKALQQPGRIAIIAELKQASPSAGVIRQVNDLDGRIKAYIQGGASALSILTEEDYFHGSPQLLERARGLTQLPLLRKDFIIDPYQIAESKSFGADAILLITSLLPGSSLREFLGETKACGLEALVEVHDEADLSHAVNAGATLIGINNRNLRTLRVDTRNAERLLAKAPKTGTTLVVESGIRAPDELPPLQKLGAQAVLIGETLMRSENPQALVKEFASACLK